jgi:hypothetical protein
MLFRDRLSNAKQNQVFFRAEFGDKTISPVASFVLGIHSANSYFCDSRCPFGQIDNRKHMLGRFRSYFLKYVMTGGLKEGIKAVRLL